MQLRVQCSLHFVWQSINKATNTQNPVLAWPTCLKQTRRDRCNGMGQGVLRWHIQRNFFVLSLQVLFPSWTLHNAIFLWDQSESLHVRVADLSGSSVGEGWSHPSWINLNWFSHSTGLSSQNAMSQVPSQVLPHGMNLCMMPMVKFSQKMNWMRRSTCTHSAYF